MHEQGRIATTHRSSLFAAAREYLGMLAVLAALVAVFTLLTDHFFSTLTFQTIANQIPDAIIIAVGMTYVLIIAGIDLSVGSVLALASGALGVAVVRHGWPVPLAMAAALGVGLGCGLLNGFVAIRWRLPTFIVTLGMMEIARGAAYLLTNSQTQYIGAPVEWLASTSVGSLAVQVGAPLRWLARTPLGGLSLPFLLAVALVAAGQLVLSYTVFGRYMIAVGTNEEAVRLSGIDPRPVKLGVFAICGALTGVAAVVHTSRMASADPNAGGGFELQAIAAVVIGGTSLMGGRGSVVRSFFGVLIIAVLDAGLAQVGASDPTKRLITGCVIVAAVILDYYRQRLRRARQ